MNILVTGANGQLGRSIRRCAEGGADRYVFTDVDELDITDAEAVDSLVGRENIDIIVNCAAYTNVDAAEDDTLAAERLNSLAVANLASAAKHRGALLIHISTDYVFGGSGCNRPLAEDAPACPTGVYGVTKLHGEEAIARSGARAIILRTAWLYSEFGRNFVKTMLNLTFTRPNLSVVFDQAGTPTYAGDLARAITDIISRRLFEGREGTYHYSNEGVCSWFDFARAIAAAAGNTACDIQPCHSDEFPSKVARPPYSVLDKTKFKNTFGLRIPYWTDSLEKCILNLSSEQ